MTERPILTPLADELRRAARRQRRSRGWARGGGLVALVAVFGSGTAGALALTGAFESDQPTDTYEQEPPEPGLRYARRPVVLARGSRGLGKRFEIVGYQLARRDGSLPPDVCLDVRLIPEGSGHGCLSPDDRFAGSTGLPSTGYTFEGAADRGVRTVRLRFVGADGERSERSASLARAVNARTLNAVGIAGPFSIWRARLPPGARRVKARAFDAAGRLAWEAVDPSEVARGRSRPMTRGERAARGRR